jgi:signal transduction histidine kinase
VARRLRSPLALRIYLVGIVQMVVCLAGFIFLHRIYRMAGAAPAHPPSSSAALPIVVFVLIVVGVSSWLLARTLTRPLRRLSQAARDFGAGHIEARVALARRDELGDVSHAFDEMADRVAALLHAERELLANVSHELRSPLARIRMALALASEGNADVARESFADIAEDIDELERLVADILTAARLDLADASTAGIPPLRCERVDPGDLVVQAASRFRASHPERTLRVDVGQTLPPIQGDPVLLRRVVDNLLENAHKYSEHPGDAVQLVARIDGHEGQDGEGLAIDVIDRGVGIAPEDLGRVFLPFFRADRSRTRATGGLGLGLTLAKRIVDAHGGRLELASAPNEGTRARVWLPVCHAGA